MEIQITGQPKMQEITASKFNVMEINKIKKLKGGAVRQESKAPTFSFDLRWDTPRDDEKPGLGRSQGQSH